MASTPDKSSSALPVAVSARTGPAAIVAVSKKSVLLISNYRSDRQQSMLRYASWLNESLTLLGLEVRRIEPHSFFGRCFRKKPGLNKWLAYVDKFIIFPIRLRMIVRSYDIVHIADHGNAPYQSFTRDVPTVVTCHDLLAVRSAMGETASRVGLTGRIFQKWILNSLKKVKFVCCISQATADDFRRLAGESDGRYVQIIPQVLNYPYSPMTEQEARQLFSTVKFTASQPFFFHVGGNNWYKNRAGVLELFAELSRKDPFKNFILVLAGAKLPSDLEMRAQMPGLAGRVRSVIEPSSEVLRAFYSSAQALLFPSLMEGFGWPILEAQACGCPVITTGREPMKTVGGSAAFYINPDDTVKSAADIEQNWEWIRSRREASLHNLSRYSQEAARTQYLEFYQMVFSKAGDAPDIHRPQSNAAS